MENCMSSDLSAYRRHSTIPFHYSIPPFQSSDCRLPLHNVWEDVRWRGEILGCPYLCIVCGGGCTLEGGILGCPYLCVMCGRGCTLEGGNPGVSLPLHSVWERMYAGGGNPGVSLPLRNVWERMYAGGGKSWGVPTSA